MDNKELIRKLISFDDESVDVSTGHVSVGSDILTSDRVFEMLGKCMRLTNSSGLEWQTPLDEMYVFDEETRTIRFNDDKKVLDCFFGWNLGVRVLIRPGEYNNTLGKHDIKIECASVFLYSNVVEEVETFMGKHMVSFFGKNSKYYPTTVSVAPWEGGFRNECPGLKTNPNLIVKNFYIEKVNIDSDFDFNKPLVLSADQTSGERIYKYSVEICPDKSIEECMKTVPDEWSYVVAREKVYELYPHLDIKIEGMVANKCRIHFDDKNIMDRNVKVGDFSAYLRMSAGVLLSPDCDITTLEIKEGTTFNEVYLDTIHGVGQIKSSLQYYDRIEMPYTNLNRKLNSINKKYAHAPIKTIVTE